MKRLEIPAGISLLDAVGYCKDQAQEHYGVVEIVFNAIRLRISEDSEPSDIFEIYRLKRKCGEYEE